MIVKFCGLRRIEDIEAVNSIKPDLAGFILVPGRRRYISPDKVCELRQHLDKDIKVVGVFVDEDIETVKGLLSDGIIDIAQLHGSESEGYIRELKGSAGAYVIKAFGILSEEDIALAESSSADMVILDSPGGGTGDIFNWSLLKKIKRPYILAGGLNVDNISEAVRTLDPYGVDVSSGIETDGSKDKAKMEAFMRLVRKGI